MTSLLVIEEAGTERRLDRADLPVVIGGPEADISVAGASATGPLAFVGMADGEPFVQPAPAVTGIRCNGDPLSTSQWLQTGDEIRIGSTSISVDRQGGDVRLRVGKRVREIDTEPPIIVAAPPPPSGGGAEVELTVRPVEFEPPSIGRGRRSGWRPHPWLLLTWIGLGFLGAAAWFLFTARAVEVRVVPPPDDLEVVGTWLQLELGERYLLRPGSYQVRAAKEGYRTLSAGLEVSRLPSQVLEFKLEKLPGLLQLETVPAAGVSVSVDGSSIGTTPLEPIELEPGQHTVTVSAGRFDAVSETIDIDGGGGTTLLRIELSPLWAPVSIESRPTGAAVRIDGGVIGVTPLTTDLLEGSHELEIRMSGFKPYGARLDVLANQPYTNPLVVLQPADGRLILTSDPTGATVSIGGEYRGQTPLEVELRPGIDHQISLSRSGYDTATASIRVESGQAREVLVGLDARYGEIDIRLQPPDAELWIDGTATDPADLPLRLTAVPHLIEVRKPGYQAFRQSLTPRPGFPQIVEVMLRTEEEARLAARQPVIETAQGQQLRLIEPGRFRMGASRREPGRRANETLRDVELTRPFYLATEEVSNREYREFREGHRSGQAGGRSLDLDDYPVASVTWEEAARYCNWLSEKEGLPPAYVIANGRLVGAEPMTTGYRLPSEAEWAWAARFAGSAAGRKYPWGDTLPVAPNSGNYADASAAGVVEATIDGYQDGFATTAPVDSFEPNAVGIFNMGGNVAEWIHDYYSVNPGSGTLQLDTLGPESGEYHVIRGSSWMDSTVTELRLSFRDYGNNPRPDLGFRIARYAD